MIVSVPFTNDTANLSRIYNETGEIGVDWIELCAEHPGAEADLNAAVQALNPDIYDALLSGLPANPPRPRFAFRPLQDDYFAREPHYADIREHFMWGVRESLTLLSGQADRLVVVIPPVHRPSVIQAGFAWRDVQVQIDDVLSICEDIAATRQDMHCVAMGEDFFDDVSNFANLTHPNDVGYARIADRLAALD